MQVSVEETGVIERRLTISIPSAEVGREIAKRLQGVAKRARIAGFRPGKAPQNLIHQRYGAQVTNEVVNDTIHASYRQALGQKEIVPAGLVSLEPQPFVAGHDLQYVATVELYPTIPSPTLAGRTITKPVCEITKQDVERTLQNIRASHAEFVAKSGKATAGDRVTINFDGAVDGKPFAGGKAENHPVVLGEGRMSEPFETALMGVQAGAAKTIRVPFPQQHADQQVAGKTVDFAVTVKAVERPIAPQLGDAFAEKLGIQEGGMQKMRAQIEINLQRELAAQQRTVVRNLVMAELLEINPIEAPKSLLEAEMERRAQAVKQRLAAQATPESAQPQVKREQFAAAAKRQVVLGLIVRDIIQTAKIEVDRAAVRARIEEVATGYDDGAALLKWYYDDPSRLQPIEAMVLEEQVVARMLETAVVAEKKISFQELMNSTAES